MLAFLVVTTGLAVFLPLYFRLGLGRAAVAFAPVCLVLLAASIALAPSAGAVPLAPPSAVVRTALAGVVASAGPIPAAALTVIGIGAVLAASAWVSTRAYEHRGL